VVEEIYDDEGVEVLASVRVRDRVNGDKGTRDVVVALRKENLIGTAFHPELTGDTRLHDWWVSQVVIPAWRKKNVQRYD
jgi:glutamine amidotransferase PdxT